MNLLHRIIECVKLVVNMFKWLRIPNIGVNKKVEQKNTSKLYPIYRSSYKYRRMDNDTFDKCKSARDRETCK